MLNNQIDWLAPTTVIAIVSTAISLVALYFSFSSASTARKALQLAQNQENRKQPSISAELADAFASLEASGHRYWIVAMIVNSSELPNSIVRAELGVWTRSQANSTENAVALRLLPASSPPPPPPNINLVTTPHRLEGNAATSGAFSFFLPSEVLNGRHIINIELRLHDSHGVLETISDIYPREMVI